ncbi:hypothetical protein [Spelaeicoccus albus]|uniref:Uncharacterized protein n=1 Tax=Spelaeicoccus albus TaxID=1280376 RepID=A0A7Z0D417_9MICO|nr:hypothetical protein [Spelaeicoccus albus]NYI68469.1 hypothetical protein [Spelaeicoccus albus]
MDIAENNHQPVTTFAELTERMTALIGTACKEELWVAMFDAHDVQMPTLCPIAEMPDEPDEFVVKLVTMFAAIVDQDADGGSLVFVRERFGPAGIVESDRRWARALSAAARDAGVRMRGVFLSHPKGVAPITADPVHAPS